MQKVALGAAICMIRGHCTNHMLQFSENGGAGRNVVRKYHNILISQVNRHTFGKNIQDRHVNDIDNKTTHKHAR